MSSQKTATTSSDKDRAAHAAKREQRIRKLIPILAFTYPATKVGWREFYRDALIAHSVGYALITVTSLGAESLGAVWRIGHEQQDEKQYTSFLGEDDDVFGVDDMDTVLLR